MARCDHTIHRLCQIAGTKKGLLWCDLIAVAGITRPQVTLEKPFIRPLLHRQNEYYLTIAINASAWYNNRVSAISRMRRESFRANKVTLYHECYTSRQQQHDDFLRHCDNIRSEVGRSVPSAEAQEAEQSV